MWPCWRRYVTGGGLWGFKSPHQTQSHSLCLLHVDQDAKLSATAPAPCLTAFCHDDHGLTYKTVSKPQLNAFFYKLSLHRNQTVTKTPTKQWIQGSLCPKQGGRWGLPPSYLWLPHMCAMAHACTHTWTGTHIYTHQTHKHTIKVKNKQTKNGKSQKRVNGWWLWRKKAKNTVLKFVGNLKIRLI